MLRQKNNAAAVPKNNTTAKGSFPIKKAHPVGKSFVLTLAPIHVHRLQIDDLTFFEQEPIEDGIILRIRRLTPK
jgi:hypothetical protein